MLYYSYPQIVLQEVPDEIALALSISGCQLACKGCHSTETWNPTFGSPLTINVLEELIRKHKHITTVLFYGGEWDVENLTLLINKAHEHALKVCLYTGLDYEELPINLVQIVDILKVGRYIPELGGIDSPTTNQKFIYNKLK